MQDKLKATVSGSFNKHLSQIASEIHALKNAGVEVLSPGSLEVVSEVGEFLVLKGDKSKNVKEIEDKHLEAIANSDFLRVVTDGYAGISTCFEIGSAVANGVPVFSSRPIANPNIRKYTCCIRDTNALILYARSLSSTITKRFYGRQVA